MRESFPSHGSGLSKDAPVRDVPAIVRLNLSILSSLIRPTTLTFQLFVGVKSRQKEKTRTRTSPGLACGAVASAKARLRGRSLGEGSFNN